MNTNISIILFSLSPFFACLIFAHHVDLRPFNFLAPSFCQHFLILTPVSNSLSSINFPCCANLPQFLHELRLHGAKIRGARILDGAMIQIKKLLKSINRLFIYKPASFSKLISRFLCLLEAPGIIHERFFLTLLRFSVLSALSQSLL